MKYRLKSLLAFVLSAVLLFAAAAPAYAADPREVTFAAMTGIRYVAQDRRDGYSDAFLLDASANGLQYENLDGLLDSALDCVGSRRPSGLKYLLLPGGLAYNGEELNHSALADRLELFERDTGISVIVCNGPKDIVNINGAHFRDGKKYRDAGLTLPSLFKSVYSECGWDEAYTAYNGSRRDTNGSLSYSVRLDGGYRLIVLDAASYDSSAFSYGGGDTAVRGVLSDGVLSWAAGQCAAAKAAGEIPVGMCGWSFGDQTGILTGGVLENAGEAANALAAAGMRFVFTGGTGLNDITRIVTDSGLVLYDVQSAPLTSFPNTLRIQTLEGARGTFDIADCDETKPVVSHTGKKFARPYRETTSLKLQFRDFDLARLTADIVRNYLTTDLIPALDVPATNTISKYLKQKKNIDVAAYLTDQLGKGVNIMGILTFFDASNVLSLLDNSFFPQLQEKFLEDPDVLTDIVYTNAKRIFDAGISSAPCTKFLKTYGFGEEEGYGTVSDLLLSCYVYAVYGNEDASGDAFLADVITNLESGQLVTFLADAILKVAVKDVLFGSILSEITMEPTYLGFFDTDEGSLGYYLQYGYEAWAFMHGQDNSVAGFINALFDIAFVRNRLLHGFTSVDDIVSWYVDNYYSGDNARDVGAGIAELVRSCSQDSDPDEQCDWTVRITASDDPVAAEATHRNFRLPSLVTMTPGKDESELYISWYTSSSVKDSDIEIYDTEPEKFYGAGYIGAAGVKADAYVEEVARSSAVIDLKLFSVGKKTLALNHHIIRLSGLESKYYYLRVGAADAGWWSPTLKAGSPDPVTTLVHISDTDASAGGQYDITSGVLDCAQFLHPDIDAVIHTGNIASGNDVSSWQRFLDDPALLSNAFAPAAGNNEYRTPALTDNTAVSKLYGDILVDAQSGTTVPQNGDYYSFDYNNVHVAVLDSGYLSAAGCVSDEQVSWLMDDMSNTAARWKIVAVHAPVYTNGVTSQAEAYKKYMTSMSMVLSEVGVDLVLCGNDCVYYRTDGVSENRTTDVVSDVAYPFGGAYYKTLLKPRGVVYSMLGSSGAKSALQHERFDVTGLTSVTGVSVDPDSPMFSVIRADDTGLLLETYTLTGNNAKRVDSVLIKKSATALSPGDVTGDGNVTAADARLALRASARLETLSSAAFAAADVNGDGNVDASDARKILRASAKLEVL